MKKCLFALLFSGIAAISFAQTGTAAKPVTGPMKIGFFDEREVLAAMPGIERLDSLIAKFIVDTVRPELTYIVSEYKEKDSAFRADSIKLPPRIREIKMRELDSLAYRVNSWNQYEQQQQQQKQAQLLAPFQEKVYAQLRKVVDEGKYTHVFTKENLLLAPPQDDLSIKVAKKLGIPVDDGETAPKGTTKPAVTKPRG